jgi:hypothetical protein
MNCLKAIPLPASCDAGKNSTWPREAPNLFLAKLQHYKLELWPKRCFFDPFEASNWATLLKKIFKNVILRCAMGGCIKVQIFFFLIFLRKRKVLEAVNFWPKISSILWHGSWYTFWPQILKFGPYTLDGKWEKAHFHSFLTFWLLKMGHSADNFFYLTTLIQLPMAHINITFAIFFLTGWLSYLPQMGLKWVKKHLLRHISSFYYCNLDNIFFGASMGHSEHILLLVQKKKNPKWPSASADGRAKMMFGMRTTNGTIWHRIFFQRI